MFVQKAFLQGFFSGELSLGGACYGNKFCVSKWVGLDNNYAYIVNNVTIFAVY